MMHRHIRIASACVFMGLLLLLSACGFRPLYGERSDGESVVTALAAIEIAPLPDRLGQMVHNHLLDVLTPRGAPADPRYRLHLTLTRTKEAVAIEQDESVARYGLDLMAEYHVTAVADGEEITSGQVRTSGTFDVVRSDFATLKAEQDVERRLAEQVGNRIKLNLAIHFERNLETEGEAGGATP